MRPCILLVETSAALLSGMEPHLVDAGFRTRLVHDQYAIKAISEDMPAVVVVGRLSDHMSRSEFCEALRRVAPLATTALIVVLSRDSELIRIRCLEAGADCCIVQPLSPDVLLRRIGSLMRSPHPTQTADLLSYEGLSIDIDQFKVFHGNRRLTLRPKEFRLLRIFLENPGTLLSRSKIRDLTGLRSKFATDRAVDSQIKLLRRALREGDLPNFIKTVRAAGYMLSMEVSPEYNARLAVQAQVSSIQRDA